MRCSVTIGSISSQTHRGSGLGTVIIVNFEQAFSAMSECYVCIHKVANSADPDQTAPPQEQSDLGLHCLHWADSSVG